MVPHGGAIVFVSYGMPSEVVPPLALFSGRSSAIFEGKHGRTGICVARVIDTCPSSGRSN